MAPAQILAAVRRTPFEPFRLVLAGGRGYDIQHPDQCMVLQKQVVIGETLHSADGLVEWTVTINPWNVVKIETESEATVGV